MNNNKRVSKVIAAFCFISLTFAVIIATNAPASGYELSIYSSTPLSVWVFLFICVIGGIGLIVYNIYMSKENDHLLFIIGPLGLAHLTVLLLPALRGYFLYASTDSLVHIGKELSISSTGHIDSNNFYPALHILITQLSQISGIPSTTVGRYLPALISTGFTIIWMYLLGKACLPERGHVLLAFILASGFLLNSQHSMLYPQMFPFLFVLSVLYLRLNKSLNRLPAAKIPLIISLLLIPFSHPEPSVMIIFFLVALEISTALFRWLTKESNHARLSLNLPLISLITFFTWIVSFVIFGQTIYFLFFSLTNPQGMTQIQKLEGLLSQTSTVSTIGLAVKMYGDSLFSLLFAILGTIFVVTRIISSKKITENLVALTAIWVIAAPLELMFFLGFGRITIGRLANLTFSIALSPLLAGYALHEIFKRTKKTIAVSFSTIILTIVWLIGLTGVYHSPWILQPSWQTTRMDVSGIKWFFENKETNILYTAVDSPFGLPYAIPHILYDHAWLRSKEDFIDSFYDEVRLQKYAGPERFKYDINETLGDYLGAERYLMMTRRFQLLTEDPFLRTEGLMQSPLLFSDFRQSDLMKLNQDPSLTKLYSNGELDVWLANASVPDRKDFPSENDKLYGAQN